MLEVLMVLTVLNTALAAAALTAGLKERRHEVMPPYRGEGEQEREGKPFRLSDKKMQEGISNLLGYEVGGKRGDEE